MTNSTNSFFFFCAVLELSFTNEYDWLLLFFFFFFFFSKRRESVSADAAAFRLSIFHPVHSSVCICRWW